MSEKNQDHQIEEEIEDNRTFEEKFTSFIQKVKPYFKKLWAKRKPFILFNTGVLILTLVYLLFLTKPFFESNITILPEYGSKSSSILSQLSGLASIAGVKVGESAPTEIYQNLISSESVLAKVIYSKYKTEKFSDPVDLIRYFEIDKSDDNTAIGKRKAFLTMVKMMQMNIISTDVDRMTRILNIKVTLPEAQLSSDVANKIVESLDLYIRTQRKSYATEQSFYIAKRTAEVKDSLISAENALKNFREQNRITSQSPNLLLEQGRLLRNVEILQTVFVELTKQLEIAKIDEIKDAPVVNVKEFTKNPVIKAGPRKLSSLITTMFFSVLLSIIFFLFKDDFLKYYKLVKS